MYRITPSFVKFLHANFNDIQLQIEIKMPQMIDVVLMSVE